MFRPRESQILYWVWILFILHTASTLFKFLLLRLHHFFSLFQFEITCFRAFESFRLRHPVKTNWADPLFQAVLYSRLLDSDNCAKFNKALRITRRFANHSSSKMKETNTLKLFLPWKNLKKKPICPHKIQFWIGHSFEKDLWKPNQLWTLIRNTFLTIHKGILVSCTPPPPTLHIVFILSTIMNIPF